MCHRLACALAASALIGCVLQSPVRAQDFYYEDGSPMEMPGEYVAYHASSRLVPEEVVAPHTVDHSTEAGDHGEYRDYGDATCDSCGGDAYGDCSCCDDVCGDPCFEECTDCCFPCGLAAGVEATYLKLDYNEANFYLPAEYDREAAPRIWLQWQGTSGWGVRSRYWDFDADQTRAGYFDYGDTLGALALVENLDATAVDLELTRAFRFEETNGYLSLGARYAELKHHLTQHVTIFDVAGGGGDDVTSIFQQGNSGLEGTGITGAIDLRRPLFRSRLAAICNLRGSYVWGKNKLDLDGAVIEAVPVGAGDLDINDFQQLNLKSSANDGMWIGELQAGGERRVPISDAYGGGNAFVRVLFEAQWWKLPGAALVDDDIEIVTPSLVHEFLGITAAAGITR